MSRVAASTASDSRSELDRIDRKILQMVAADGSMSFQDIASRLSISKSTVHNRIKLLQSSGAIKGFHAILDPEKLDNTITAISLVRGRYGPKYSENIGKLIAKIRGVWAVYFVMGDMDFVVLIRCRTKEELSNIIEQLTRVEGVERSSTFYALRTIKENIQDSVLIDDAPDAQKQNSGKRSRHGNSSKERVQ
ncbi:MAG: Lrp/AsnC family transcriptional regulator [Candidatus Thermoplasmatota archaeon]|nr:Lrp/AsnC family transcriptional regulator [Candidatus Thermoplasmatota archaeon]MCL5437184.1 Lrp/AsnC family transcriptional regulator [Candidatus Thermoplasmatota archaeon]